MQGWLLKYILGSTHFPPNLQPLLPLVKVKCIMGHRDVSSDACLNKMGVHAEPTLQFGAYSGGASTNKYV